MTPCSQCNRAFAAHELVATLCAECRPEAPKLTSPLVNTALAIGAVPFFFHFTVIDNDIYRDWVAISAGQVAAVLGFIAVVLALRADVRHQPRIAIAATAVLLGVIQLGRGFGVGV